METVEAAEMSRSLKKLPTYKHSSLNELEQSFTGHQREQFRVFNARQQEKKEKRRKFDQLSRQIKRHELPPGIPIKTHGRGRTTRTIIKKEPKQGKKIFKPKPPPFPPPDDGEEQFNLAPAPPMVQQLREGNISQQNWGQSQLRFGSSANVPVILPSGGNISNEDFSGSIDEEYPMESSSTPSANNMSGEHVPRSPRPVFLQEINTAQNSLQPEQSRPILPDANDLDSGRRNSLISKIKGVLETRRRVIGSHDDEIEW